MDGSMGDAVKFLALVGPLEDELKKRSSHDAVHWYFVVTQAMQMFGAWEMYDRYAGTHDDMLKAKASNNNDEILRAIDRSEEQMDLAAAELSAWLRDKLGVPVILAYQITPCCNAALSLVFDETGGHVFDPQRDQTPRRPETVDVPLVAEAEEASREEPLGKRKLRIRWSRG